MQGQRKPWVQKLTAFWVITRGLPAFYRMSRCSIKGFHMLYNIFVSYICVITPPWWNKLQAAEDAFLPCWQGYDSKDGYRTHPTAL